MLLSCILLDRVGENHLAENGNKEDQDGERSDESSDTMEVHQNGVPMMELGEPSTASSNGLYVPKHEPAQVYLLTN